MKTEVTEEQKEHLDELIEMGEKLEAIRFCQLTFSLDAEQAITMVERLEQQREQELDAELDASGKELEKSTANLPNIIGGIFAAIGLILIILAAFFGYRTHTFLQKAVPLPGIVTGFHEFQVKNTEYKTMSTVYAPVIEYQYEGKPYSYKSPYGSSEPAYKVGDQIPLLINPAKPGDPDEDSFMGQWFVTLLLGSLGLVFTGVGMVVRRAFSRP